MSEGTRHDQSAGPGLFVMKISRLYLNLLSWSGPRFSGAKVISIKFWSFITTAVPMARVQNSAPPGPGFKKTNQISDLYQ